MGSPPWIMPAANASVVPYRKELLDSEGTASALDAPRGQPHHPYEYAAEAALHRPTRRIPPLHGGSDLPPQPAPQLFEVRQGKRLHLEMREIVIAAALRRTNIHPQLPRDRSLRLADGDEASLRMRQGQQVGAIDRILR